MQHIFYRTLRNWMWVVEVKKRRRTNGCLERMILLIVSKVYLDILYLTQMVFSRGFNLICREPKETREMLCHCEFYIVITVICATIREKHCKVACISFDKSDYFCSEDILNWSFYFVHKTCTLNFTCYTFVKTIDKYLNGTVVKSVRGCTVMLLRGALVIFTQCLQYVIYQSLFNMNNWL